MKKLATNILSFIFLVCKNFLLFFLIIGANIKATAKRRETTPPNFDGIDRRMAYANRKYHSGWMWIGATIGFAGEKFSTSPARYGKQVAINMVVITIGVVVFRSFIEKIGENSIFSMFSLEPVGLDDPVSCSIAMWTITRIVIIIGVMKCREKNRVRVGCETEKFPHIHSTSDFPM